MNRQTNLEDSTAATRATLLMLNDDCLDAIFQFLELDDRMNLAETCCRLEAVYDPSYKKYGKCVFDRDLMEKENDYIDSVFFYINRYLTSMYIELCGDKEEYVLSKAKENCWNLRSLTIFGEFKNDGYYEDAYRMPSLCGLDNLEAVKLENCNFSNEEDFLGNVCNLKFLNIFRCGLHESALEKCFDKNPNLVSFSFYGENFDFVKLQLQLLPNLESITLRMWPNWSDYWNFNSLMQLNRLTTLRLNCGYRNFRSASNLNDVLVKLSEYGTLRELQLCNIEIDENSFIALKSFESLEFLSIYLYAFKWNSSFNLAPHLTDLQFWRFKISINQIASIIQQLQSLRNFILTHCTTETNITSILKELSSGMDRNVPNTMLNVVFKSSEYQSEQIFTAGRLRIFCSHDYPKNVRVRSTNFSGQYGA